MEDLPIAGYASTTEMLEDLYINEGLTMMQIAMRLDVNHETIRKWMQELGVPIRKPGGANRHPKLSWSLHRMDPRVVYKNHDLFLASLLGCSRSIVYKYKKRMAEIWTSASSAPPVG